MRGQFLVADQVSGNQNKVRMKRVDLFDNSLHSIRWHVRPGDMNVRQKDQPYGRFEVSDVQRGGENDWIRNGHPIHPCQKGQACKKGDQNSPHR